MVQRLSTTSSSLHPLKVYSIPIRCIMSLVSVGLRRHWMKRIHCRREPNQHRRQWEKYMTYRPESMVFLICMGRCLVVKTVYTSSAQQEIRGCPIHSTRRLTHRWTV